MGQTRFSQRLPSPDLGFVRAEMERALWGEVLPLYERGLDREGFVAVLGEDWCPGAMGERGIVQAARMTWTAAELVRRRGPAAAAFREHAVHGVRTIRDKFLDPEHGGVFWRVRPGGGATEASRGRKHLYGVAFAIYGLANAADVLGDAEAGGLAFRLFDWLERYAPDMDCGGYFECFARDGRVLGEGDEEAERPGDDIPRPAWCKSMNAQLHAMEALTALVRLRRDPRVVERLRALIEIFFERVVDASGWAHQYFSRTWEPRRGETSYGHDVEIGYLLVESVEAVWPERSEQAWLVARAMVDHSLRWGFDHERGGLFSEGPAGRPATDRTKVWWAQAEMINACSMLDARCGVETAVYRDAMLRNWAFCREWMVDWERGGWRWSVEAAGVPVGTTDKATPWKTAYHTARAMMSTTDRLAGAEE